MARAKDLTLREVRKRHIAMTLSRTGWDVQATCRLLKVSEAYLEKEIRRLGIPNGTKGAKRGS
jgi:hypothetical protein